MDVVPYLTERKAHENHILLDANEHYTQWVRMPISSVSNLNRYPDQDSIKLRNKLSKVYCQPLTPQNILITSGSMEAIDILMYTLRPNQLIINNPSYDVYTHRAEIHQISTVGISFCSNGQPDVDKILSINRPGDMVVLINPNNPTGRLIDPSVLDKICEEFLGTIVIDEAYIEYSGLANSFQHLVKTNSNVVVLRSFSKAWGLAGARLGYMLASPKMVTKMHSYKSIYSVNSLALAVGLSALDQINDLQKYVEKVLIAKRHLINKIQKIGLLVEDTDANFVLIHLEKPLRIARKLRDNGVIVRPRQGIGKSDVLRVTVGSEADNNRLIELLEEFVSE